MDGNKRELWCKHNAQPDLCIICSETKPLEAQLATEKAYSQSLKTRLYLREMRIKELEEGGDGY